MERKESIKLVNNCLIVILIILSVFIIQAQMVKADSVTQGVTILPPVETRGGGISSPILGEASPSPNIPSFPITPVIPSIKITVPPVSSVIKAIIKQERVVFTDIPTVASTFGLDVNILNSRIKQVSSVVHDQIQKNSGVSLQGFLKVPLPIILSAISVRNPELSTPRGMQGFVDDMVMVIGGQLIEAADKDERKAEIVTKLAASTALGQPLDRRVFDQRFKELGKVLWKQEREVMTSGEFQRFFQRNPKTNEEWRIIKHIAYRGRIMPEERLLSREIAARERYERIFKLNLAQLTQSKEPLDQERVAQSWSFIRSVTASRLRFPQ